MELGIIVFWILASFPSVGFILYLIKSGESDPWMYVAWIGVVGLNLFVGFLARTVDAFMPAGVEWVYLAINLLATIILFVPSNILTAVSSAISKGHLALKYDSVNTGQN